MRLASSVLVVLALRPVLDTSSNPAAKRKAENYSLVMSTSIIPGMIFQKQSAKSQKLRRMNYGSRRIPNDPLPVR